MPDAATSSVASLCRATCLTPAGRGAVATIQVWGPWATACVSRYFVSAAGKPLADFPLHRIIFGKWHSDREMEEEVVVCRRAATSVEVHCHGGLASSRAIMAALVAAGAEELEATDWAEIHLADRLAAEARLALAEARTERTAAILLDQYRGALRRAITATLDDLQSQARASAAERLQELAAFGPLGLHLTQPWRIVVAGPPNAGKSSLVNRIVGYERAIVFDQPGTTRDLLSTSTALDGWPVELLDTAGLRVGEDAIEAEGVRRARHAAGQADLLLLIFDANSPWSKADQQLVDRYPQAVVIGNKQDLPRARSLPVPCVPTSVVTGSGFAELIARIVAALCPTAPAAGAAVPFTRRQLDTLQSARTALSDGAPDAASALLRTL